jgi:lysylphosphatidylglycerol synthetase-like protein (DUF2156 family)
LLILTILILTYFGISTISVYFFNIYFLKLFYYIFFSLIISYNLLCLYLLNKFSNKNIQISEVLPEFVINWLMVNEDFSISKAGIKEFKTISYLEITYLILMTLTIIVTFVITLGSLYFIEYMY